MVLGPVSPPRNRFVPLAVDYRPVTYVNYSNICDAITMALTLKC